jgi:hypothetical protein
LGIVSAAMLRAQSRMAFGVEKMWNVDGWLNPPKFGDML